MIGERLQRPIDWDSIHQCCFNQLSSKTSHSVSFERNEFGTLARNLNPASVRELSEKFLCHERESKGSREIDRKSERQRERSSARDGKMSTCLTAKMSVWVATLEGFKTWELMRRHLVRWEISFSLPPLQRFVFISFYSAQTRTHILQVCMYIYTVCVQWKWPCSRQSFLNFCNVHVFVSFVWERELLKATNGCQLDSSILLCWLSWD